MTNLTTLPTDKVSSMWSNIEVVLTDIDDTLTCDGTLPPETLMALSQLQAANIKVYGVTGACAGWCDHISQLWPVDGVLGENGAFLLSKKNGYLSLDSELPLKQVRANQAKLKQQILMILEDHPDLSLTLDQEYRLAEVAIDIGQNRPKVDQAIIEEVLAKIHALGANATASSIHINAWYGEHSKKVAAFQLMADLGLQPQDIQSKVCYVGDSLNDQQMFQTLELTVGVANIKHYWQKLAHHPSVVMTQDGGYGFAEFTNKLLAVKQQ